MRFQGNQAWSQALLQHRHVGRDDIQNTYWLEGCRPPLIRTMEQSWQCKVPPSVTGFQSWPRRVEWLGLGKFWGARVALFTQS